MPQPINPFDTIRIPLIGISNARQVFSGAASTKDQRFINFIPMKFVNPMTDKETFYLVKRPGLKSHITPAAGKLATALYVWDSVNSGPILSAFSTSLSTGNSTIYEDTANLGDITGRALSFTETTFTGTSTVVIPSTDGTAWYCTSGGTPTKIADADYPGNAGRTPVGQFVAMDGYLFIMDSTGRIYNSDLNSITAWTSTAFIKPTYYTGHGIGLARMKDSIVAIMSNSIEFFTNEGESPSPLARREMIVNNIGGIRSNGVGSTYCQVREKVAFIGVSHLGSAGVYLIDEYRVKKISTQMIDQQIEALSAEQGHLRPLKLFGLDMLLLNMSQTYAYIFDYDIWVEFQSAGGGIESQLFTYVAGKSLGDNLVYVASNQSNSGKIYNWDTNNPSYTDDNGAYTASFQTSKIDLDTEKRKRFHKIKVIGDKQTSTSNLALSWSDDDYATESTARNVDLGSDRPYLTQCGIARRRSIIGEHSANTPCRIEALEIDFSLCAN